METKDRKKRLGQYFSSLELGTLLGYISLALNRDIKTAIDPMFGRGDLLKGLNDIRKELSFHGIELDRSLKKEIEQKITFPVEFTFGDSFISHTYQRLGKNSFDLVITNPPYVRYQNQKLSCEMNGFHVPAAEEIRSNLIATLSNLEIPDDEKELMIRITKFYTGLSDLTIPSILLCSALTSKGGILALILPESVLTRDYSYPGLMNLLKFFEIKAVIKDGRRAWFHDVQVKTLLLVAKKLPKMRESIFDHPNFPVIEVEDYSSSPEWPLGKHSVGNKAKFFKEFAQLLIKDPTSLSKKGCFDVSLLGPRNLLNNFSFNQQAISALFPEMENYTGESQEKVHPEERFSNAIQCMDWIRIQDLGIHVYQGLRTGANSFFYWDLVEKRKDYFVVRTKINELQSTVSMPTSSLKTVLRRQAELPQGYKVKKKSLQGKVLTLSNFFTRGDVQEYNIKLNGSNRILGKEFESFLDLVSEYNLGSHDNPKYIPKMSAVRTNENTKDGSNIKKWYQLPSLKPRHLPQICIPRVNSKTPKAFSVENDTVVDANFITVIASKEDVWDRYATLALLNSDWVRLNLETAGNVMGGGALKLDRSHFQNLLIPREILRKSSCLSILGKGLESDITELEKINKIVNEVLGLKDKKGNYLKTELKRKIRVRTKNGRV